MLMFILGAVCASVAWFFIWRNNKEKMAAMAKRMEPMADKAENMVKKAKDKVKARM